MTEWFGTEDHGPRTGKCYALALSGLIRRAPWSATLVHGSIYNAAYSEKGRIGHGWLELEDGTVWEPVHGDLFEGPVWESYASPEYEARYTKDDALHLMLTSGHSGPWTPAEVKKMERLRDEADAF